MYNPLMSIIKYSADLYSGMQNIAKKVGDSLTLPSALERIAFAGDTDYFLNRTAPNPYGIFHYNIGKARLLGPDRVEATREDGKKITFNFRGQRSPREYVIKVLKGNEVPVNGGIINKILGILNGKKK